MDAIQLSGKLLLGIVNDVLDLSHLESRDVSLQSTAFALRALVEDTVHLMAEPAQDKGLELCCRIDPRLPTQVTGDPGRVRQVLFNLVGNAVKFTERGRIVVRADLWEGEEQRQGVRLTVEDTGIGIPETDQKDLFEIFQRGDPDRVRRFSGSGLGLAITKRLVEVTGGEIGFRSDPGAGSRFWCTLPLQELKPAVEPEPVPDAPRALVVQGLPTSRAFLVELLQRLGIETVEAATGEAGQRSADRAVAAGRPFALAFIDLDLPCGDGRGLARDLQAGGHGTAVTLLAPFTAHGLRAGSEEEGWAYLLKPVREKELAARVWEALALTDHVPPGRVSPPMEAPAPVAPGRKVLLAEDNPVNREVMLQFLKLLGHDVDVVEDGGAAVEAALSQTYDLVFMDWRMPGMDGLEATKQIRRREPRGQRVPIVALTAHALADYREHALAAGSDEFLTKPVELRDVAGALARFGSKRMDAGAKPMPEPSRAHHGLDRAGQKLHELLQHLSPERAWDILDAFLRGLPQQIEALRQAVAAGDAPRVAAEAHRVRGTLTTFGSVRAVELATLLEQSGDTAELAGAGVSVEELQAEAARLLDYLREARRKSGESP